MGCTALRVVSCPRCRDADDHTAEAPALCDAQAFGLWRHLPAGERPEEYLALKAWIEEGMLAQFRRQFPALAPMLPFHELSTLLTWRDVWRRDDCATAGPGRA